MIKDAWRVSGLAIALGVVVLATLIALGSMAIFGWGFFQRTTADFRGETAQREQVHADPDYRIAAYEHFFDLCATVQSNEDTLANLNTELHAGPSADREEQLYATITAVRNARNEAIREYNADARKSETRAAFLDSDLPYQLDPSEEHTTCTA